MFFFSNSSKSYYNCIENPKILEQKQLKYTTNFLQNTVPVIRGKLTCRKICTVVNYMYKFSWLILLHCPAYRSINYTIFTSVHILLNIMHIWKSVSISILCSKPIRFAPS